MAERVIQWNDTSKEKFGSWGIDDFIAWHRGLVQHFGNEKAKKKDGTVTNITKADYAFMMGWVAGRMPYKMDGIIAVPSYYKDQIAYIRKYPTIYEMLQFKKIDQMAPYNPVNLVAGVAETAVGVVDDISDTIGLVVKILKYVAIAAVIGGAIWGGMYLYKKSQTA